MKPVKAKDFKGFTKRSVEFLFALKMHNNKTWFEQYKQDYLDYVLKPMQDLVSDLGPFLKKIDPQLEIRPAVGKTISRIYRDIRFSNDKSPYKSRIWAGFKRDIEDWQDAPGFYFELSPERYSYGMGAYNTTKETMDNFRAHLTEKPDEFLQVISFLKSKDNELMIEGDKYKRLKETDASARLREWFQYKNFYVHRTRDIDRTVFSTKLVERIAEDFQKMKPLYKYLWKIKPVTHKEQHKTAKI
jgi:uncharacterized protein (TIGR02453 family)